jgi:hypothetical protein
MEDIIGSQYIAWGGAVNIIFSEVNLHGTRFSPFKRLNPDDINSIDATGDNREREILSIVIHRTNLPNAWRHISFEKVTEQIQRDERKHLREQAIETGETAEYVALLEKENAELEKKVASAENTASENETLFLQVDDENRQLRYQIDGLELSLSHVNKTTTIEIPTYIQNILDSISKYMTPKESLVLVSNLFSDRIVVLNDAWESVDNSNDFREKKKAFELLWKLSTQYWETLASGKGDTEARKVFGRNEYASNEGDMAGNIKATRDARTFTYKCKDIEMMKHLKCGRADSSTETIRIHFEWDSEDKKIIIGHCGPHLRHK